jgi:hypothetical protein
LKGFVRNRDNPKLFVIDGKERRSFCTAPENVAAERDFHRIEADGYEPDALENSLAGFETEVSHALRRIISARSIKDENDRSYLLNLMALLSVKNPLQRENIRGFHEQVLKRILDLATATPERWASQVRRAKADGSIPPDADTDYAGMRAFVKADQYKIKLRTGRHLQLELKSFETVLPFFFRRHWVLLKAPRRQTGFVTTDHPVCLMWSDPAARGRFHGPGHGLLGTQVLFPISNDLAVMGAFEAYDDEMNIEPLLIAQINATLILYARQTYARDGHFLYKMEHNSRIMRGFELLEDQAKSRPATES